MKLLLDENLSPALVRDLADIFTSLHVRDCGLARASDTDVWNYARWNDCLITSKDSDFHQRSLVFGPPPKVIWIRRGNCSSGDITSILREAAPAIQRFASDPAEALLILD
jgi:predicted nuclease of predicted toxin-antitoxin system